MQALILLWFCSVLVLGNTNNKHHDSRYYQCSCPTGYVTRHAITLSQTYANWTLNALSGAGATDSFATLVKIGLFATHPDQVPPVGYYRAKQPMGYYQNPPPYVQHALPETCGLPTYTCADNPCGSFGTVQCIDHFGADRFGVGSYSCVCGVGAASNGLELIRVPDLRAKYNILRRGKTTEPSSSTGEGDWDTAFPFQTESNEMWEWKWDSFEVGLDLFSSGEMAADLLKFPSSFPNAWRFFERGDDLAENRPDLSGKVFGQAMSLWNSTTRNRLLQLEPGATGGNQLHERRPGATSSGGTISSASNRKLSGQSFDSTGARYEPFMGVALVPVKENGTNLGNGTNWELDGSGKFVFVVPAVEDHCIP